MGPVEKYRHYNKNKNKMANNTMMSLYDYLGRAAGPELGKQVAVAATASKKKVLFETRYVSNSRYEGDVLLYPKWFLDEFFGGTNESKSNNKQLLFG